MSKLVRILGIAGSLRRESYNRAALREATKLLPEDATLDIFELDGIPGTELFVDGGFGASMSE